MSGHKGRRFSQVVRLVDLIGIEPATSSMPVLGPNWNRSRSLAANKSSSAQKAGRWPLYPRIRPCVQWRCGLQNELEWLRCSVRRLGSRQPGEGLHRTMQRIASAAAFHAETTCALASIHSTTDLPLLDGTGPSPEERASCSDCLYVIS
jgi:hypothetical protein